MDGREVGQQSCGFQHGACQRRGLVRHDHQRVDLRQRAQQLRHVREGGALGGRVQQRDLVEVAAQPPGEGRRVHVVQHRGAQRPLDEGVRPVADPAAHGGAVEARQAGVHEGRVQGQGDARGTVHQRAVQVEGDGLDAHARPPAASSRKAAMLRW
jgi:hypothetical protein